MLDSSPVVHPSKKCTRDSKTVQLNGLHSNMADVAEGGDPGAGSADPATSKAISYACGYSGGYEAARCSPCAKPLPTYSSNRGSSPLADYCVAPSCAHSVICNMSRSLTSLRMCRIEDKGDRTIISSKLIPDEAMGVCVKLTGLEGIQTDQVSIKIHMRLCMCVICVYKSEWISQSVTRSEFVHAPVKQQRDPRSGSLYA